MTYEEYKQWLKENPPARFKFIINGKTYEGEELKLPDEGVGNITCANFHDINLATQIKKQPVN